MEIDRETLERWADNSGRTINNEIRALLADAGLTIRREWGGYDGEPFAPDASRHVFLSVRGEG